MAAEMMTIREVAQVLRLTDRTIYEKARISDLAGFKIRNQWRFRCHDLDLRINTQVNVTLQVSGA